MDPDALDALQSLCRSASWWPGDRQKALELLGRLDRADEPRCWPWLLPLTVSERDSIGEVVARYLHRWLSRIPPGRLAAVAEGLRPRYPPEGIPGQPYGRFHPENLTKLCQYGEAGVSLVGLASMHPNGFLRARALELLQGEPGGLRYLLLRVNDWVLEVRDLATRFVLQSLQPERADEIVTCLSLVLRLTRCRREDHSSLVKAVCLRLQEEPFREALLRGCDSADKVVRRQSFRLALAGKEWPAALLARALRSGDQMVRRWATEQAPDYLQGQDLRNFLDQALANRSHSVRQNALVLLLKRFPEEAEPVLLKAALDRSHSVRHLARYYLEKRGVVDDFAAFYREKLDHGAPALLGLGEKGSPGDKDLLRSYLEAPEPRVKRAALEALGQLDPSGSTEDFLKALRHAETAKAARAQLSRAPAPTSKLWPMTSPENPEHCRRNALELLLGVKNHWERLENLLRGAALESEELSQHALDRLRNVLHTRRLQPYAPPEEVRRRLKELSREVAPRLTPQERRYLDGFLE